MIGYSQAIQVQNIPLTSFSVEGEKKEKFKFDDIFSFGFELKLIFDAIADAIKKKAVKAQEATNERIELINKSEA